MTDYTPIIDMLTKADGPDREIDAFIHCFATYREFPKFEGNDLVFRGVDRPPVSWLLGRIDPGRINRNFSEAYMKPALPAYTASLDAAISLTERLLPGWGHGYDHRKAWGQYGFVAAVVADGKDGPIHTASGVSAPLTLLTALFRALQAQEGK